MGAEGAELGALKERSNGVEVARCWGGRAEILHRRTQRRQRPYVVQDGRGFGSGTSSSVGEEDADGRA